MPSQHGTLEATELRFEQRRRRGQDLEEADLAGAADGVVPEFRLGLRLSEHQTVVEVRALGLGHEQLGELLEGLDWCVRILLRDVVENRTVQTLGVGLADGRDDLAGDADPTEQNGAGERQQRESLAGPAHSVSSFCFGCGAYCRAGPGGKGTTEFE